MLTKSDYTHLYLQCPIHLWAWKHRRAELEHHAKDPQLLWTFEQGNMVERVARLLFPDGVLIESQDDRTEARTRELIGAGVTTIFQAAAIGGRLLALADVLRFDPATKRWDIYEVKSSTSVKEEYLHDLGFQRLAFTRAGYEVGKLYLVHVNSEYVRRGKIDPQALLLIDDVTDDVNDNHDVVAENVAKALAVVDSGAVHPRTCTCSPKGCPCGQYCYPGLPEYSIFDLYNIRTAKARALYDAGIRDFKDLPEDFAFSEAQACQVKVAKSGEPLIKHAEIRDALQKLSYPLYFLDYETFYPAIPSFDGYTPYQQMVFQYSLHVIASPGGTPEHRDYLATEWRDPMQHVAARLREDIGDEGSVIVWNKSFEMNRNEEMADRIPELAGFLRGINRRVFDLMEIFRRQLYVHPDFRGSNSIKDILPVLVPGLSYDPLEIKEGASASLTWYRMLTDGRDANARDKTCKDLRTYCTLDTFAMVEIFRYLLAL